MSKYDAMTTNERLAEAGLLDQFDAAVNSGNRALMVKILGCIGFEPAAATAMSDKIMQHPTRYGRGTSG